MDGDEEEVVNEEDYNTTLHDNEIAMNENDLLRIPEGFVHEVLVMAEALQSMETKLYVCQKMLSPESFGRRKIDEDTHATMPRQEYTGRT